MNKVINLSGKRFTKLLVICRVTNDKNGSVCWFCKCDCGNYKIIRGSSLKSGLTKSCGCLRRKQNWINAQQSRTHGMYGTPEYQAWISMKTRCYNLKNNKYKNYGGRGITVCDRWLYSFAAFFKDMGKRPGPEYSIERINNDGNYELGNCKWATILEQNNNKRLSSLCKEFKAISPIGRVYISKNQHEFARQFNLHCANINGCLAGRRKTHKGWKFTFLSS